MEVAEVAFYSFKQQDILFATFVKSRLVCTILYCPVEDFRHEHGHRILEYAASYSMKRIFKAEVACRIQIRMGRFDDFCL